MKYSEAMITQLGNTFAQEIKQIIAHCVGVQHQEVTAADVGEELHGVIPNLKHCYSRPPQKGGKWNAFIH